MVKKERTTLLSARGLQLPPASTALLGITLFLVPKTALDALREVILDRKRVPALNAVMATKALIIRLPTIVLTPTLA